MSVELFGIVATIGTIGYLLVSIFFALENISLKRQIHWILVGSVMAIAGSLTLSGIYTLPPCTFCWWQRILIYPTLVMTWAAAYAPTKPLLRAIGIMAGIGALVAAYHVFLQLGIVTSGVCGAGTVACTRIDLAIWGFMTIPAMSLATALGISISAFSASRKA